MSNRKILCFDFDGVIHSYMSGWNGYTNADDKPVEGIKEALNILKEEYEIVIYSSRCKYKEGIACIKNYMKKYNLFYDSISDKKRIAWLTIVDRAICFDGNTDNLMKNIKNFKSWNR